MKAIWILISVFLLTFSRPSESKVCNGIGDIVFLIDSSTSVGPVNLKTIKNFVIDTISSMWIGPNHVRVGAASFNTKPSIDFMLNTYSNKADVIKGIKSIKFTEGLTFLGEAFRYVRTSFKGKFRKNVPKLIVLISDGNSNGLLSDVKEARKLKQEGVQIIAVGATKKIDIKAMRAMSSRGKMYHVKNVNALKTILTKVSATACKALKSSKRKPCNGFPVDLMFVLDSSTSVGDENWKKQQKFLVDLVKPFQIGKKTSRVGLLTFNTQAKMVFNIGTINSFKGVKKALMKAKFTEGATFTGQALQKVFQQAVPRFRKGNFARIVILITDGRSNGFINPYKWANKIKAAGAHLLTVGITSQIKRKELKKISSNGKVYTASTFDKLKTLVKRLQKKTCKYSKNAKTKKKASKIQKKKIEKKKKKAKKNKKKKNITKCKKKKLDLVFVLDSSSSVGPYNWKKELQFLARLTKSLNIRSGRARVALVTYNTFIKFRFGLGSHKTSKGLRRAIKNIKFTEGLTFTGEALQMVKDKIEPTFRKGVKKLVFLVTDGKTNGYENPVKVASELKKKGVTIISVGITKLIDKQQLKAISSAGKIYKVRNQKKLDKIVPDISKDICK